MSSERQPIQPPLTTNKITLVGNNPSSRSRSPAAGDTQIPSVSREVTETDSSSPAVSSLPPSVKDGLYGITPVVIGTLSVLSEPTVGGNSTPGSGPVSMTTSANQSPSSPSNGHVGGGTHFGSSEELDTVGVRLRKSSRRELRHALSEGVMPAENPRRRSQTMLEAKEHAYSRLQEELTNAQSELKLKDEECEKLLKVRDQIGEELEELTASLFEEANNMVQDANVKRMHAEKLMTEANQKVEILQAEVAALKQLVLTSTPASPNKHLHPQIDENKEEKKEKKNSKPFWKTHRRSTSHHQFTKESRIEAEAQSEARNDRCIEIDTVCLEEFKNWRQNPVLNRCCEFLGRIASEDIGPCLNFNNHELAQRVHSCVENNTLTIEPISGDSSYPRRCCLSDTHKLCNFKIRLGEDQLWYSISQQCRNRIAAVCDFFTYIRYIHQGLVKSEDKDVFYEVTRLRKMMALARLGYV